MEEQKINLISRREELKKELKKIYKQLQAIASYEIYHKEKHKKTFCECCNLNVKNMEIHYISKRHKKNKQIYDEDNNNKINTPKYDNDKKEGSFF